MAYGTEAVLPVEIGARTLRIDKFSPQSSEEGLRLDNDLLEESRDSTHFKVCQYQDKIAKYYNSKIKLREFKKGDLVLREAAASMPSKMSKLSPPWEGPYRVTKVVRPGTYRLETLDHSQRMECSPSEEILSLKVGKANKQKCANLSYPLIYAISKLGSSKHMFA